MKHELQKQFYQGHCFHAYELFGAHLCMENGVKGVRFTTFAPKARKIQVIGSFNHWSCEDHYMKKLDHHGIWSCFVPGATSHDTYKFRVHQCTGRIVDKMDPYAFYSELRPNTASIITDFNYHWSDEKWMNHRTNDVNQPINIYELHLASWKYDEEGNWFTYRNITKPLITYVKKHHFTHIEFMPLNEHPFDGSWGYQSSGYFSLTSRYGTPHDFMYLVNECHKKGIGVIMDFVPVHFVKDDFSLAKFDGSCVYEYEKEEDANSQWDTLNFDLGKETVRSFLLSAAAFWIQQYHLDGLRMDAISNLIFWHGNKEKGENKGALDFIKRMNYHLHELYQGVILIAEDSSDYPNVTKSTLENGLGFDYKWDLGWMHDTFHYFSKDPIYRKWHHHDITFSMAYFYSEHFILPFSHDEVVHGKKTIIDKIWGTYEQKFQQLRTLYTYMYTHPGKKLNFMGNELAMFREWSEAKETDWFLLKYPIHDAFQHFFQDLTKLYLTKKALFQHDYSYESFEWIDADNEDENLYSYIRKSNTSELVVILNLSSNLYEHHKFGVTHHGTYTEIFNSEKDCYGGSNIVNHEKIKSMKKQWNHKPYLIEVTIAPFGSVILETKKRNRN